MYHPGMDRLNYHHLLYFWTVARTGSVARASTELRLAQPTISGQIRQLEEALEEKLFQRAGRGLALTEMGRLVFRYAEEIFALGRELGEVVRGQPTGRPQRLVIGIADVVPKIVALHLLAPVLELAEPVRIVCREGKSERLLADLAAQELDVVLTDAPLPPGARVKAYSHLLAESGVQFFGVPELARRYRSGFPGSLDRAPLYLPTESTAMRRALDQWFEEEGVRPFIRGEFDDSALMKVFAQGGGALFPAPALLALDIEQRYGVESVGLVPLASVRERFYVVSAERRIRNPAVLAISRVARSLHPDSLAERARQSSGASGAADRSDRSERPARVPVPSGGRTSSRPGSSSRGSSPKARSSSPRKKRPT